MNIGPSAILQINYNTISVEILSVCEFMCLHECESVCHCVCPYCPQLHNFFRV